MMQTIRLYGKMGKLFGRVHRADLATGSVAEAVAYLRANFKGVDEYLGRAKTRDGVGFAVFRGKENLAKDQLRDPCFGEEIRIAPIILGSKKAGVFQIIIGAVIVVVGAVLTAYGYGSIGVPMMKFGATIIAGGIIQMLTPRPKGLSAQDRPESTPSYAFNGPVNTQAQGHPVPVLYGKMWVGSAVVSAGMDVKDDIRVPLNGAQAPGGSVGFLLGLMGRMSNGAIPSTVPA